ncbi:MAG: PfkB family carbohydrate kinase, partial [candidate division KSB1 bacterium]|nr:PfkB family carbohydrate kinase [candidate division KSB1 bacterium]
MDFDCLGFGICAVDYLCLVPKYPGTDEKTEALEFAMQGGGPVATALTTLARLGRRTSFISRIGDDDNGKFLVNEFIRAGVNISGLIIDPNMPTQQAFIWIDASNGKRSIVLNSSRYRPIAPGELKLEYVRSAKYLLIDGRDTEATVAMAHWAKAHGTKIVL